MVNTQVQRPAAAWRSGAIAMGKADLASVLTSLMAALGYFALGAICLTLSRFDATLGSIWLPNAGAVAVLLLARMRNELPAYAGFGAASLAANALVGNSLPISLIFSFANLIDILLVTSLTRLSCGPRPHMADLSHLGRFLQYGGMVGPACASLTAYLALQLIGDADWLATVSWFLADSMGMILIVPAVLLMAEALGKTTRANAREVIETAAFFVGGLLSVYLVFAQDAYPLMFLVPPVTLLVAFRLGGLGTAFYVPIVAAAASLMTFAGHGPIASYAGPEAGKAFLFQSFVAANFLTGLPIAAILAGRVRLTDELARGRSELTLLTESITDAVLRLDRRGLCIYASPSVYDVLGRAPQTFLGRAITEPAHEDAHERIDATLGKLLSGESEKERVTYRRQTDDQHGAPVFIEADCAIARDPATGESDGIVVSARDVTERVELELLLTRARREAEDAASAKSEFLANMSHEIRTPMNGVLGFAELMLQGELQAEERRHTKMIVQSGRSMMHLLNDVLDLSKIEAGEIGIDRKPIDLYAAICECAQLHKPNAEKRGLQLHIPSPPTDEHDRPWVLIDGLRLRQILLNLIGNAVKFTEEGSVEIRLKTEAERFLIEIEDTGIGISRARLETIFAPFTQAESDTSRRFGGTGLGLTISRKLAELLGGNIEVDSEVGAGSTFRLKLPAYYVDPVLPETSEDDIPEPHDLPKASRILLVEDHDVNRVLATEMLQRCGQAVEIAHDGNEAIAMVIESIMRGKPYDLLLMDIQMPGCDGYAATRAIRAEGISSTELPVIALTANAYPEDIAAAREAGMQAHLSKPLVFAELARTLQRWLPTRIIAADGGEERTRYEDSSGPPESAEAGTTIVDTSRGDDPAPRLRNPARSLRQAAHGRVRSATSADLSPHLVERWNKRRLEAVEAVRGALESGELGKQAMAVEDSKRLERLVHKLAGTAAIFGEAELGDQAAALERALRLNLDREVTAALAFELLSVADDPLDTSE